MQSFSVVYYHYFRHHRDSKSAFDVTEREVDEARGIALHLGNQLGLHVIPEVEHFETLPENDSKYLTLLAQQTPTVVIMQDMRLFAQSAGVKGLRLLRDSILQGVVPITISELDNDRVRRAFDARDFDDLRQRIADVIVPLTAHIDNEKPHGIGRQRTKEITQLMIAAYQGIRDNRIVDRSSLLGFLTSVVQLRYAAPSFSTTVFAPEAWRTYKYKLRLKMEESLSSTYQLLTGKEIPGVAVWTTHIEGPNGPVSIAAFVSEACIRQLESDTN